MKYFICIVVLLTFCFSISLASAQNKVVVIPMGSGAKGTDGQVQYNDEGKTAGAEVYYDKTTGKLELPGELRTVDGAGNNRLWGKDRPGIGLMTHTGANGYCTTSAGVKFALSSHLAPSTSAESVCPAGTWVCNYDELPSSGDCPIVPLVTISSIGCDGMVNPPAEKTFLNGWVSNADDFSSDGYEPGRGVVRFSDNFTLKALVQSCVMYRVWCCWD